MQGFPQELLPKIEALINNGPEESPLILRTITEYPGPIYLVLACDEDDRANVHGYLIRLDANGELFLEPAVSAWLC
jgi:hypothetical protein